MTTLPANKTESRSCAPIIPRSYFCEQRQKQAFLDHDQAKDEHDGNPGAAMKDGGKRNPPPISETRSDGPHMIGYK